MPLLSDERAEVRFAALGGRVPAPLWNCGGYFVRQGHGQLDAAVHSVRRVRIDFESNSAAKARRPKEED